MSESEKWSFPDLEFQPLTPDRWADFERLFGPRGACAGCWCMWWRQTGGEFKRLKGEPNRLAMKSLVESGARPGIIAWLDGEPVGWCAVAPRGEYLRLARSRTLKPLDSRPVWSIVCLFVDRRSRRRGISVALVRAAAEYALSQGAETVEAYPVVPRSENAPALYLYPGVPQTYERAGFRKAAQPAPGRLIMRYGAEGVNES